MPSELPVGAQGEQVTVEPDEATIGSLDLGQLLGTTCEQLGGESKSSLGQVPSRERTMMVGGKPAIFESVQSPAQSIRVQIEALTELVLSASAFDAKHADQRVGQRSKVSANLAPPSRSIDSCSTPRGQPPPQLACGQRRAIKLRTIPGTLHAMSKLPKQRARRLGVGLISTAGAPAVGLIASHRYGLALAIFCIALLPASCVEVLNSKVAVEWARSRSRRVTVREVGHLVGTLDDRQQTQAIAWTRAVLSAGRYAESGYEESARKRRPTPRELRSPRF